MTTPFLSVAGAFVAARVTVADRRIEEEVFLVIVDVGLAAVACFIVIACCIVMIFVVRR